MTTCTLANRHSKADRMWRELVPSFAMNQAIFFKFANGVSRTNQQGPVHRVYHADEFSSALRANKMIRFETALVELWTTASTEAKSRFAFRTFSQLKSSGGPINSRCRARVLHSTNSEATPRA